MKPPYPDGNHTSSLGWALAYKQPYQVLKEFVCENFLLPATNYKIALFLSRKIL
jgi:hypothetical protein